MREPCDVDVAIVGAGICGLAAAHLLRKAGRTVRVLEAASRPGGRIRSFNAPESCEALGDRGPTWVWPEYQPVVARWLNELDIDTFRQFNDGKSIVEMDADTPPATTFLPAQYASMRIAGGTGCLIERLMAQIDEGTVETDTKVSRIEGDDDGVLLHHLDGSLRAAQAIVSVPPRIAANTIDWTPALPGDLLSALNGLPTWMAPHAKAVVVYEQPFWRAVGLSGRIASRVGPLMEVHDHCSADGETAALFGFIGWPSAVRNQHKDNLPDLIVQQLVRCFGQSAAQPTHVLIEDWSCNALIAHPLDLSGQQSHPDVGPEIVRQPIWQDRVVFAAAETARQSPGLIEGAFVAAQTAATSLLSVAKAKQQAGARRRSAARSVDNL